MLKNNMNPGERIKPAAFEKINGRLVLFFSIVIAVLMYWRWFLPGIITYGDFYFITKEALADNLPFTWISLYKTGVYFTFSMPLSPFLMLWGLLVKFSGFGFEVLERILVFFPMIIILIVSPWVLARVLGFSNYGTAAMILVFNLNSVIFLVTGVAYLEIAIALGPLVFAAFIRMLEKPGLRSAVLFALASTLQIIFELRIFYVISAFCFLYTLYSVLFIFQRNKNILWQVFKTFLWSAIMVVFLNAYWVILLILQKFSSGSVSVTLPGYDNPGWVSHNSYFTLFHALTLDSPFWGNFGKLNDVSFHFLFLPILALSALLICKNQRKVTFFALGVVVFSFLVKGDNFPFGVIYMWLFKYFPGFAAFRDPGKWYMPLIISYAVLFGFFAEETVPRILRTLRDKISKDSHGLRFMVPLIGILVFFVIFPVNPISAMRYGGIFKLSKFPEEYYRLNRFLHSQQEFFRILWLPNHYRFGYASSQHPGLNAITLSDDLFSGLCSGDIRIWQYKFSYIDELLVNSFLRLLSVKYIIIPEATRGNLPQYYWYELPAEFYNDTVKNIKGLTAIDLNGKTKIYEVPKPLPHIYTSTKNKVMVGDSDKAIPFVVREGWVKEDSPVLVQADTVTSDDKELFGAKDYIFSNENLYDLALSSSGGLALPLNINKNNISRIFRVTIEREGVYELWIKLSQLNGDRIILKSQLDGQSSRKLNLLKEERKERQHFRFLKIADYKLTNGLHKLKISIKVSSLGPAFNLPILLVNKDSRINSEKATLERFSSKNKNFNYVFSKSGTFNVR